MRPNLEIAGLPEPFIPRQPLRPPWGGALRRARAFAAACGGAARAARALVDGAAWHGAVRQLRADALHAAADERALDAWRVRAFALAAERCRRDLGLAPFDIQLAAGWLLLHGRLVEMHTGEGKTLAVMLAAAAAALAGTAVHVVTANDYLAARDAARLSSVYAGLGLRAGCIAPSLDAPARRRVYAGDVAYCTGQELVFDYLRDGLAAPRETPELLHRARRLASGIPPAAGDGRVLRGLSLALIDEADSLLLDDAQTPLVLSQPRPGAPPAAWWREARYLAARLDEGRHYRPPSPEDGTALTPDGLDLLERDAAPLGGHWLDPRRRDAAVCLALTAEKALLRDRDYLVRDGRVELIDRMTGRVAAGRRYSNGLHTLLELKERVPVQAETGPVAQITYQQFFPRYRQLGGLSGTLREARRELRATYGLPVVALPERLPSRRVVAPTRYFVSNTRLWAAVVRRVRALHAKGRPVLVGVDGIAEALRLVEQLAQAGVAARALHAASAAEEACIVAAAGARGAVTVATTMAGRGTDILLANGVGALGGLQVINTQCNAARRLDRQLAGRAARQGDPGGAESLVALNSPRMCAFWPIWLLQWAARRADKQGVLPGWWAAPLFTLPQRRAELAAAADRWRLRVSTENAERGTLLLKARK